MNPKFLSSPITVLLISIINYNIISASAQDPAVIDVGTATNKPPLDVPHLVAYFTQIGAAITSLNTTISALTSENYDVADEIHSGFHEVRSIVKEATKRAEEPILPPPQPSGTGTNTTSPLLTALTTLEPIALSTLQNLISKQPIAAGFTKHNPIKQINKDLEKLRDR
ncbi:hypothetical protein CVT24_012349, partial [Panaeolus cyanescens]